MRGILLTTAILASSALQAQYGSNSDPYANSNNVRNRYNDCQRKANELVDKMNQRTADYKRDEKEFLAGEFCSDCNRSKSQVEKETRTSFAQHIQEGAKNGRRVVRATQKQLDDLHRKYKSEWDNLNNQYENAKKNCNDLNNQYNQAKNQDYNNIVKGQQEAAQRAQDEKNRQDQERLQKLQDDMRRREQELEQQRIREQIARDEMIQKMTDINRETEAQKEAYKQESQLTKGYNDRSSDARSLLDPSRAANDSEVFGSYLNEKGTTDFERKGNLLNSVVDQYNQFKQSVRDQLPSFFGRKVNESDNLWSDGEEEQPSGGWSFERTRLNRRVVQPLKNLYNWANDKLEKMENYEDKYTRNYELWEAARPKTDRETREAIGENADRLMNATGRVFDAFSSGDDDELYEASNNLEYEIDYYGKKAPADAIGNLLGKSRTIRRLDRLYERTIGGRVDRLMNWYRRGRGAMQ